MAASVFVSYSRRNKPFVEKLVERLKETDRVIWVDWEDIPWTADWWQEIRDGIDRSDAFLFVMSEASLSSVVCTMEVAHAIANNKRLVPIVYEQADAADAQQVLAKTELDDVANNMLKGRDLVDMAKENWTRLARHNWMFFDDEVKFDESFGYLEDALDLDVEYLSRHTKLHTRSLEWQNNDKRPGYLLRGVGLEQAEDWLRDSGDESPPPTRLQTEFIMSSRKNANRQQQRILGSVVTALVATIALAIVAIFYWFEAENQAEISEAGRVALQGLLELEERQLDRALLLAVSALNVRDTTEARSSLLTSLQSAPRLLTFQHDQDTWLRTVEALDDGFATADIDGGIVLRDAEGNPTGTLVGHEAGVWDLAYHDGALASVGDDGQIMLWDLQTGDAANTFTTEEPTVIYTVAFSPDGTQLATGHDDMTARLWDVASGEILAEMPHGDWVSRVVFSPDGETLAAGSRDARIYLWTLSDPEEPRKLEGHPNWVFALAYSPDGLSLASGAADNTVRLWDATTGEPLGSPHTDHENWVRDIVFSADGTRLASASADGRLILRDPTNGRRVRGAAPLVAHTDEAFGLAFDASGDRLLSVDKAGDVLLWDVTEVQPLRATLATLETDAFTVVTSGEFVITGSGADGIGLVTVWDADGNAAAEFEAEGEVTRVAASGTTFAFVSATGRLYIGDLESLSITHDIAAHDAAARDLTFAPNGDQLLTVGDDGAISAWEVATGISAGEPQTAHEHAVWAVAMRPNTTQFATGDDAGNVFLWETGGDIVRLEGLHTDAITALAYSDNLLAVASRDGTVTLLDSTNGEQIGAKLEDHANWVLDLAFSPDGAILATGSRDETIILWDAATGQPIGQPLEGADDWVWGVHFRADGNVLAAGTRAGSVDLWTTDLNAWRARACAIANRRLSASERISFLGEATDTIECEAALLSF